MLCPREQSWREPVPSLLFATYSTTQWHTDGPLSFQTTCNLGATRKGYRKNPALFSLERALPKCTELVLPPPCHHLRGWRTEPPPEPNCISPSRAPVPNSASTPTPPVPAPHLQKVSVALQCPSSGSLHVLSSWITIRYPILSSLGQNRLELYNLRAQRSLIGHYILYPFILLVRKLGASAATRLTQGHTFQLLMTAWINDYLLNFLLCQ